MWAHLEATALCSYAPTFTAGCCASAPRARPAPPQHTRLLRAPPPAFRPLATRRLRQPPSPTATTAPRCWAAAATGRTRAGPTSPSTACLWPRRCAQPPPAGARTTWCGASRARARRCWRAAARRAARSSCSETRRRSPGPRPHRPARRAPPRTRRTSTSSSTRSPSSCCRSAFCSCFRCSVRQWAPRCEGSAATAFARCLPNR